VFEVPPTVTFAGVGNFPAPPKVNAKPKVITRAQKLAAALKACRKDVHEKKHVACEQRARRKYGPVKKRKRA
jgi:hypothetical protein